MHILELFAEKIRKASALAAPSPHPLSVSSHRLVAMGSASAVREGIFLLCPAATVAFQIFQRHSAKEGKPRSFLTGLFGTWKK